MKFSNQFVAVLSVVSISILAGCGGDENKKAGVTSDGLCEQGYIDSYNDLVVAKRSASVYFNKDGSLNSSGQRDQMAVYNAVKNVDAKCDSFLGKFKGSNCKASLQDNGQATTTDTTPIEKSCSEIKAALNGNSTSNSTLTASTTSSTQTAFEESFEANAELDAIPSNDPNVEQMSQDEVEQSADQSAVYEQR